MERLKIKSHSRGLDKEIFPSLRSTITTNSKPLLALTRVDLDSKGLQKEPHPDKNKQRSISGQFRRYNKYLPNSTTSKGFYERPSSYAADNFQLQTLSPIEQEETYKNSENHYNFDKAKTSFKSYGFVKAYCANSNSGPLNQVNEDRICIVTNLNRAVNRGKQISYFAIYDGKNGSGMASYLLNHLHLMISEESDLLRDAESCIRRAIQRAFKNYQLETKNEDHIPIASINLVLTIGETAYCLQSGDSQFVLSMNLGSEIICLSEKAKKVIKDVRPIGLNRTFGKSFIQSKETTPTESILTKYDLASGDFILFGSEGLAEGSKGSDVVRRVWTILLQHKSGDIHTALGEVADTLMHDAYIRNCSKNISVVILGLNGLEQCLELDHNKKLPHIDSLETVQEISTAKFFKATL